MRLICTITENQHSNPYEFSYYLTSQGIENECEEIQENKSKLYRIWVLDEDLVDSALKHYEEYHSNPHDPRFRAHSEFAARKQEEKIAQENNETENANQPPRRGLLSPAPYG